MKNENVTWVNESDELDNEGFYEDNWIISANDIFRSFEYMEEEPLIRLPLAA